MSTTGKKIEVQKQTDLFGISRGYFYKELLDRLFKVLGNENTGMIPEKRLSIQPPKLGKDGSKKTIFLNFGPICSTLKRDKEHLLHYISAELGTTASIQQGGGLVMKGRFSPKGIENVLKNYIKEYVLCESCASGNTILKKDLETRLLFLHCLRCEAWHSVNQVRPEFISKIKKKNIKKLSFSR